ncbi:MAG: hotdog domain-containing protein [Pseudomonadota bacterium]
MSYREPQIRTTAMPSDLNPYGGVFGGWLMAQMALGSGSLASRRANAKAVVVYATDFTFPGAMQTGDELSIYCNIIATGRTSITIEAEGVSRTRNGEEKLKVCTGTFKFVALDENEQPLPIPSQG